MSNALGSTSDRPVSQRGVPARLVPALSGLDRWMRHRTVKSEQSTMIRPVTQLFKE